LAHYIRVSTIAYTPVEKGDDWMPRTRRKMADLLTEAARAKPDIVCFPEFCNVLGLGDEAYDLAEPIPGPTSDAMAKLAREHKMHVVLPIPERDRNRLHNTAAFIDRTGEVIGKYHKYQPTIGEMEHGIVPGVDAEVFQTDLGPVGAAICFDMKFVEVGQRLAANGARLVFFPSMFIAGDRLLHWARDFGFYLVSSCPARSYIVDMAGRFLAETGGEINQVSAGLVPPIASAVINMDRCLFHLDGNQNELPDILKKYGPGVELEIHYPEAHFTMASAMKDVTVQDIIDEFDLEPWCDYLNRARKVRDQMLKKAARRKG
jgi:predicted amidohydrolase